MKRCFTTIKEYYDLIVHNKGNAQKFIKDISNKSDAFTYILRETLSSMLDGLDNGKLGKIHSINNDIYKDVCGYYYAQVIKRIGKSTNGTNSSLWMYRWD